MRKNIVAGNWKMNGNLELIQGFMPKISSVAAELQGADVMVFPPMPYIARAQAVAGDELVIGAQNAAEHSAGAYTGEVSAEMLADLGVKVVILGHSERRSLYGETNSVIAQKTKAALAQQLKVILCVGETLEERDAGRAKDVVLEQLSSVLDAQDSVSASSLVVAYEPVWAIGTGQTATPEQAQEMHACIRAALNGHSAELGQGCSILYGGSVNASNADELFAQPDIDGGLVGGASLKANDFIKICRSLG